VADRPPPHCRVASHAHLHACRVAQLVILETRALALSHSPPHSLSLLVRSLSWSHSPRRSSTSRAPQALLCHRSSSSAATTAYCSSHLATSSSRHCRWLPLAGTAGRCQPPRLPLLPWPAGQGPPPPMLLLAAAGRGPQLATVMSSGPPELP
jgi:hypothetical protein